MPTLQANDAPLENGCATCGCAYDGRRTWVNGIEGPRCPECNRARRPAALTLERVCKAADLMRKMTAQHEDDLRRFMLVPMRIPLSQPLHLVPDPLPMRETIDVKVDIKSLTPEDQEYIDRQIEAFKYAFDAHCHVSPPPSIVVGIAADDVPAGAPMKVVTPHNINERCGFEGPVSCLDDVPSYKPGPTIYCQGPWLEDWE